MVSVIEPTTPMENGDRHIPGRLSTRRDHERGSPPNFKLEFFPEERSPSGLHNRTPDLGSHATHDSSPPQMVGLGNEDVMSLGPCIDPWD